MSYIRNILLVTFFFQLLYLELGGFYPQLNLQQLIQPNLESRFIVRSRLAPSIQSGSSPSAGLQVVKQSTHLSRDCYPQLILNPHRSKIRPPQQLDCRSMPLHPGTQTTVDFIFITCQCFKYSSITFAACYIAVPVWFIVSLNFNSSSYFIWTIKFVDLTLCKMP